MPASAKIWRIDRENDSSILAPCQIEMSAIENLDPAPRRLERVANRLVESLALLSRKQAMIGMGSEQAKVLVSRVAAAPRISANGHGFEKARVCEQFGNGPLFGVPPRRERAQERRRPLRIGRVQSTAERPAGVSMG